MAQATQYELKLAGRMARLGTETAFEVLSKAKALERQGKSIIHLEIGEPDFDTPANIVEAAVDALRKGWTHYGPSAGLPELRQAIAHYVSRTRGVEVSPDEVVVVPGGKPIMFFTMLALIDEGDEVIYPNPGFPIYESMINYVGGKAVPIQLREERDFAPDCRRAARAHHGSNQAHHSQFAAESHRRRPARARISSRWRASSATATSWCSPTRSTAACSLKASRFSIMSMPGMKERTILLDGFSKTYAMTGWRIGYGVMRADLAAQITRLMTNSNSCTASFTQMAGIEALRGDQSAVSRMCAEFKRRSRVLCRRPEPASRASAAACPRARSTSSRTSPKTGWKSKPLADALLEQAGVAALSGTAFGNFGEGYLRFSVANSHGESDRSARAHRPWTKENL